MGEQRENILFTSNNCRRVGLSSVSSGNLHNFNSEGSL